MGNVKLQDFNYNPIKTIRLICKKITTQHIRRKKEADQIKAYDEYLEALLLVEAVAKRFNFDLVYPEMTEEKLQNIQLIVDFCAAIKKNFDNRTEWQNIDREADQANSGRQIKADVFKTDLEIIQQRVNELRDLTQYSKIFARDHQRRLLKQLERFQRTLHSQDTFFDLLQEYF